MPYKKRYTRKRPSNFNKYAGRARTTLQVASTALSTAMAIKRLMNVEIKNFDTQLLGVAVTDTPLITQLTNIPVGDSTNQRDGSQCKMVGVRLTYLLNRNASGTNATFIRVMLVIDKQTNQAIYLTSDLLEDATSGDNIVSPRNLDNLKRFTILYDRTHILSATGGDGAKFNKYFKKDLLLRFDASTSAIADLTQSSLSLWAVGSEPTNDPTITAFVRVRFVDN